MRPSRPGAGAALVALALLAGCGAAGAPAGGRPPAGPGGAFTIAGLVRDTGGLPVGGLPVRVLSSERPVALDERVDNDALTVVAEGETAPDGVYRLSFPIPPLPRYHYLSFYAPGRFDDVRFARPNRVDITGLVRAGRSRVYDFHLAFHGRWPKVQELLKAYAKDSPKARIIRAYGIAEEIRKKEGSPGVEEWWYYSKGKNFSFRGDALIGEASFRPILK